MIKAPQNSFRLIIAQLVCILILIVEFFADVIDKKIGIFTWKAHEYLEYAEVVSVCILIILTVFVVRNQSKRINFEKERNRVLSLDISILINEILFDKNLTKTEREIAWLNIKGYSNTEISDLRSISDSTVKKHQSKIYEKFEVNNRSNFLSEILDIIIDGKIEYKS